MGDSLEAGLGFRLGRAHRMMREAWADLITDLGLTPPQAAMLRAVCEWPGSGLRELGRRTHTDAMNAKRLLDHLERAELVRSVPDAGHRQRRVLHPTGTGTSTAAELARRAGAWNRHLGRRLGRGELAELQRLLTRLEGVLAPHASTAPHRIGRVAGRADTD